jgi:hypothetical protein
MKFTLKKIAVTGALTGALSAATFGFGAGVATADTGDIPFVPGGGSSDWQSYFPLVEQLGDFVNVGKLGDFGKGNAPSTNKLGDLGGLGGLGNLGNLGSGNWQGLLGMLGG